MGNPSLLGMGKNAQASLIPGSFSNWFLQAFYGFQVMVEKIGLRVQNDVEVIEIALEIRHQYFDSRIWVAMSDGPYGGCPYFGSAIRQIVAPGLRK